MLCIGGSLTPIPSKPSAPTISVRVSPTRNIPSSFVPTISLLVTVGYHPTTSLINSTDASFTPLNPLHKSPTAPTNRKVDFPTPYCTQLSLLVFSSHDFSRPTFIRKNETPPGFGPFPSWTNFTTFTPTQATHSPSLSELNPVSSIHSSSRHSSSFSTLSRPLLLFSSSRKSIKKHIPKFSPYSKPATPPAPFIPSAFQKT